MADIHNQTYVMKIMSGKMHDHEIIINLNANLIIIGEGDTYKTNVTDEGFTGYSIPSHLENFSFSIISHEGKIAIDLHTKNQSEIIPINLQETVLKELFPFSLKEIDTPWETPLITEDKQWQPIKTEKKYNKFNKSPYNYKFFTGLSLFVCILVGYCFFPNNSTLQKDAQLQSIENMLIGSTQKIIVTKNNNNTPLILVQSQRDYDWSMQQLLKTKFRNNFSIKMKNQLENEIENKISNEIPDLLNIDITDPCNPVINSLSNLNMLEGNNFIEKTFKNYFSCYTGYTSNIVNFDELLKNAELGLTESHVKWHKITKNNKTIFMIKDSLNDNQTISLINFVNSFYQQWGNQQIQFSISLENNKFAGKSFIKNTDGYILLGSNHWLFDFNTL
ncbi:PrgH/EprH family type III secretion apparatus protein [Providencia vermicola]|uniref:PrgH/EprH family type III secretion apparatus protein n=1 Tax=Providencia vermicola TaxID=333965 RepID=UPI0032D9B81B